jgi:hypothetical protein
LISQLSEVNILAGLGALLAFLGIVFGILMLRKYDFSYKNNFWLLITGFIISILCAAAILNYSGINDSWSRRGPMKRIYEQFEDTKPSFPGRQGQGKGRGF